MTMVTTLRLTIRQHRFAFALLVGGVATSVAAGLVFILWLQAIGFIDCRATGYALGAAIDPATADRCSRIGETVNGVTPTVLMPITWAGNLAPLIGALLVAAPLIASELEFGTATLSWSLARSRVAWLLPRMALVMVVAVSLGAVAGLVLDALTALLQLAGSPWDSLEGYAARGALVAARTVAVVASGLLAGALMGRQVAALALGGLMAAVLCIGVALAGDSINRASQVVLDGVSGLTLDMRPQEIATGTILDWSEMPTELTPDSPEWNAKYRWIVLGIPNSQAAAVVWRDVALHVAPAAMLLVLTAVVVERRRPYAA